MTSRTNERPISPAVAKQMFVRMLRSWASDVLSLQRRGLDRPSHRDGLWATNSAADGPWLIAGKAEVRVRKAA
ncbi:MAG: hypothetical protein ACK4WH_05540 [Phycisphaerales bacterium]